MDFGAFITGLVVFVVFLCFIGLFRALNKRIEPTASHKGRRSAAGTSSSGGSDGGFFYGGYDGGGDSGGGDGGGGGD
jgi:hypothetical protein